MEFRFRDKIINDIENKLWNTHRTIRRKSNNLVDYNSNKSIVSKEDKIKDEIATRLGKSLNSNVYNLFGTQTTYRKRIEQYEHIANFPEIDEALDIISNEVVNFSFSNKIITQDFTPIGDENIDSETKSNINKIFDDMLIKDYNIRKRMKKDTKKFLIYGELYYQKILSHDKKNVYDVRFINPKNIYPVFWNGQPIMFIEILDFESLNSDEIDLLAENIDAVIQSKLQSITDNNFLGHKDIDPTNLPQTYASAYNSNYGRYGNYGSMNEESMYKIYNPEEIIYVRYDEDIQNKDSVVSYLDKLKVPFNRLQTMESQLLLFRMTRSVLNYVINLDVGDMSQKRREQLLEKYIDDFNAEEEYSNNGNMESVKSVQTALKHWYFTKGGDISGSDVTTLDNSADFDKIQDILHFEKKFLRALKIPVHRWQNRSEATTANFMSGEVINEELEFNNFTSNIKLSLETLIVDLFQTRLVLEGFSTTIINESNFEFTWSEKNFYRLFVNKTITETYADMASKLDKYYTPEQILTEVFELNDAQLADVIKSRVRHKKYLKAVWDDDTELTEDIEVYLEKNYFNTNDEYDSKLVKKSPSKNVVTPKHKKDEKINYFVNAINYVKKVIDDVELENTNLIGI